VTLLRAGDIGVVELRRPRPFVVFSSYAQDDASLQTELDRHLAGLRRQSLARFWHAGIVLVGTDVVSEARKCIDEADIILLLVSANYICSDYCYDTELPRAIERHRRNEARVIPIIVRSCDWSGTPFADIRSLPSNKTPVTLWDNRDEAWTDVAKGIRQAIEELRG